MKPFVDLAESLLCIATEDLPSQEGMQAMRRQCAQAARLYGEYADKDTPGFDRQLCAFLTSEDLVESADDERGWLAWQGIAMALEQLFPHYIPSILVSGDREIVMDGPTAMRVRYPEGRWKQRARHYEGLCRLLAALASGKLDRVAECWFRVTCAARIWQAIGTNVNLKNAKSYLSKACDKGELKWTTYHFWRRIEPVSLFAWIGKREESKFREGPYEDDLRVDNFS
jgi:TPR repeat protein